MLRNPNILVNLQRVLSCVADALESLPQRSVMLLLWTLISCVVGPLTTHRFHPSLASGWKLCFGVPPNGVPSRFSNDHNEVDQAP